MRRVRKGFKRLEYVDRALDKWLPRIKPINQYESIPVRESAYRVLAQDVLAESDHPPFDRSAMDGYAVRSVDVSSASPRNPIRLKVIGYSTTGKPFRGRVGEGEAVKIDTGAEMPDGADAVVMIEYVEEGEGYIDVYKSVSRFENVSLKGEDIRKGEVILPKGRLIHPLDLPSLLSTSLEEVLVYRRVKIGIVSFGSELSLDPPREEGMIRESNRDMVKTLLQGFPVDFIDMGIVPDDMDMVLETLGKMAGEVDLIVSTGGTSLGDDDVVGKAAYKLGEVLVHGVALQPSKPVLLAYIGDTPYIGLPGYPVAAAISSHVFLIPTVARLAGVKGEVVYPVVKGILTRRVASKPGLRHYVRVKVREVDGEIYIEPIYASGAGVTSSLAKADGYLIIPEDVEGVEKGSMVEAILYRWVVET